MCVCVFVNEDKKKHFTTNCNRLVFNLTNVSSTHRSSSHFKVTTEMIRMCAIKCVVSTYGACACSTLLIWKLYEVFIEIIFFLYTHGLAVQ